MTNNKYSDGTYWLVTLDMVGGGLEEYLVRCKEDPLHNDEFLNDVLPGWEDDYMNNYAEYEEDYPYEENFDSEEEYENACAEFEDRFKGEISESSELITQEINEDYTDKYLDNMGVCNLIKES